MQADAPAAMVDQSLAAEFSLRSQPVWVSPRMRLAGLLIVLAVAVLPFLLGTVFAVYGSGVVATQSATRYRYSYSLLTELTSLALLGYVIHQNGQRVSDLGLSLQTCDIQHAFLLMVAGSVAYQFSFLVIARVYMSLEGHTPPPPFIPAAGLGVTLFTLIFALVNPFFEELIVRAFLISETVALTGSSVLAVAISVGLQTAYHLYQGRVYAGAIGVTFLIFSIYYVRTHRILPVILAHLWFDVWGLVVNPLFRSGHS